MASPPFFSFDAIPPGYPVPDNPGITPDITIFNGEPVAQTRRVARAFPLGTSSSSTATQLQPEIYAQASQYYIPCGQDVSWSWDSRLEMFIHHKECVPCAQLLGMDS
jgi:hypothetical protein